MQKKDSSTSRNLEKEGKEETEIVPMPGNQEFVRDFGGNLGSDCKQFCICPIWMIHEKMTEQERAGSCTLLLFCAILEKFKTSIKKILFNLTIFYCGL